jgi:hypothetical protein
MGKGDSLGLKAQQRRAKGAEEFTARGFKQVEVARVINVVAHGAIRVGDALVMDERC